MQLKCLIIDDEPVARKLLKEYIEDVPFLGLCGEAENPLRAQALLSALPIDLIFLDINMPKLSGIEFLRTATNLPMVILTTAYAQHALDGFALDVLDYLVKPFSFERFVKACNKAFEYHELKVNAQRRKVPDSYFYVKCNGRIEKVAYDELLFVEASLNYVVLHMTRGKMMVYLTISGIAKGLPSELFMKVHKSYIVNVGKIDSIEGNLLHIGSAQIPISQNLYEHTMTTILKNKMVKR